MDEAWEEPTINDKTERFGAKREEWRGVVEDDGLTVAEGKRYEAEEEKVEMGEGRGRKKWWRERWMAREVDGQDEDKKDRTREGCYGGNDGEPRC